MQRKKSHTAMLTEEESKFEWLRLQLWVTKTQWLTDMQESLLFVSVVESFYWVINSSVVSSLLIIPIKSISPFSSLQSFYPLSLTVNIHTEACFINFFVFVYPYKWGLLFIRPQRKSIEISLHLIFEQ